MHDTFEQPVGGREQQPNLDHFIVIINAYQVSLNKDKDKDKIDKYHVNQVGVHE